MFENINHVLKKRLNQYSLSNQVEAARICFEANELYRDVFEAISFRNGILTIGVANSIKAQEIQMQSPEIIKKINQKIGAELINKLKYRVK